MKQLSIEEAYRAMFYFLEDYYGLTQSDEVGGLLGGLALLNDGKPADPASWEDWLQAVERARVDFESVKFRLVEPD